jgi:hypothetical protein
LENGIWLKFKGVGLAANCSFHWQEKQRNTILSEEDFKGSAPPAGPPWSPSKKDRE